MKPHYPKSRLFLSTCCLTLALLRLMFLGGVRKQILLWKATDQEFMAFSLHATHYLWYLQKQPLVSYAKAPCDSTVVLNAELTGLTSILLISLWEILTSSIEKQAKQEEQQQL